MIQTQCRIPSWRLNSDRNIAQRRNHSHLETLGSGPTGAPIASSISSSNEDIFSLMLRPLVAPAGPLEVALQPDSSGYVKCRADRSGSSDTVKLTAQTSPFILISGCYDPDWCSSVVSMSMLFHRCSLQSILEYQYQSIPSSAWSTFSFRLGILGLDQRSSGDGTMGSHWPPLRQIPAGKFLRHHFSIDVASRLETSCAVY